MTRAAFLLALVMAAGCGFVPELARPKRSPHRTWAEERGTAQLANGVTFNAVMVWPAEQQDRYIADLEREVEAYRAAPWGGMR